MSILQDKLKAFFMFGLLTVSSIAHTADLELIKWFKSNSEVQQRISIELIEGISKMQALGKSCEGVRFNRTFSMLFRPRDIRYTEVETINGKHLEVMGCSSDHLEKLLELLDSVQVNASAWMRLYITALEAASQTDAEAEMELLRFQAQEKQTIKELEKALAKKNVKYSALKKTLFGVLAIGGLILIAASGVGAVVIIGGVIFGGSAAGLGSALLLAAALGGAGAVSNHYGQKGYDDVNSMEISHQELRERIEDRLEVLKGSQLFLDSIGTKPRMHPRNLNRLL